MSDIILGIDLGTSTTEAAVFRGGKPEMILNFDGEAITPSAVGIDENKELIYGEKARAQYLLFPENTVVEAKRKIGSGEKIPMGDKTYTAGGISALLLKHVKQYAEEYLGEEITRAVISVPAYFDDLQRQETVKAGEDAGFVVERIINEPTASALSYGISHMDEESYILVYDLGGGTFDVTLLELFEGVVEVKASSGDNQLGGKDFDEAIINYLAKSFRKKHSIDLMKDKAAVVKLKEQAEACKKALSIQDSFRVLVPFIAQKKGEPLGLDETITVSDFENLTAGLLKRTHGPIDVVLNDSGLTREEIDMILLVGGSTRMPMIRRDVEDYLEKAPCQAVNPDYAVAEGAAVMAGMLSGQISREDGIVMTDVNPYTLGIRAGLDGDYNHMSVMIPRNVTIPTSRTDYFYTSVDYQQAAAIEVYQGEEEDIRENHFLGKFELGDIPPAKAGKEAIKVEFSYNVNGMLGVRAEIMSTGAQASIHIDMMRQDNDTAAEELSEWKNSALAKEYRGIIRRAERWLENPDSFNALYSREDVQECLDNLKRALIEEDEDQAWALGDELTEFIME